MKNHSRLKEQLWQFLLSGAVFFVVTMPFKYYFALMDVTEIRPAAVLPPFFGILFGLPGSLGCAVSNFIADIISGYTLSMSLASFPIQILMGILPHILWYRIPEKDGKKPSFPKMDTTAHVVKYLKSEAKRS